MKFEKISLKAILAQELFNIINPAELKTPKRATAGSAGYDFFAPFDFKLYPGQELKIPTGYRVKLDPDKVLIIVPRSSLGFKYYCRLSNTTGVIDSDYYNSDNEGHIWIKLRNESKKTLFHKNVMEIKKGQAIAQGIILPYFTVTNDNTIEERNGGFGSTDK